MLHFHSRIPGAGTMSLCKGKIFLLLQMFSQEQHWPKKVNFVLKSSSFFLEKSGKIRNDPKKNLNSENSNMIKRSC